MGTYRAAWASGWRARRARGRSSSTLPPCARKEAISTRPCCAPPRSSAASQQQRWLGLFRPPERFGLAALARVPPPEHVEQVREAVEIAYRLRIDLFLARQMHDAPLSPAADRARQMQV